MKQDICFWMNFEAVRRNLPLFCLNTAIEATSLNDRSCGALREQDQFIRDHITAKDYLVVSVGGNDIALTPTLCTVLNLLLVSWFTPAVCIDRFSCAVVPNLLRPCPGADLGCCGCGLQGCLCYFACGCPPGIGYFVDLFKNRVENYVLRLLPDKSQRPKKVMVCTIYFLDEARTGSWADGALKCMCYDIVPGRLQSAIRAIFRLATQRISIPGTEVVAFPLFEVLDGKTSEDYDNRVEPSELGGKKMAAGMMEALFGGATYAPIPLVMDDTRES